MRIKSTMLFMAVVIMLVCSVAISTGHADNFSEIERLANQGDADAQLELGVMYFDGDGVTQDYIKSAYWLEKAAEQGHVIAQARLGYMYYSGDYIAQDYAKATYWTEKAAEQGKGSAQYLLGMMYYNGEGVTQDKQKACRLYRAAADKNIQEALDLYIKDCQ